MGHLSRDARFVHIHYLPSDGIIWEINFLLKYKISPESLFKLQREIWGKEILPNFNYSRDVCGRGAAGSRIVSWCQIQICFCAIRRFPGHTAWTAALLKPGASLGREGVRTTGPALGCSDSEGEEEAKLALVIPEGTGTHLSPGCTFYVSVRDLIPLET